MHSGEGSKQYGDPIFVDRVRDIYRSITRKLLAQNLTSAEHLGVSTDPVSFYPSELEPFETSPASWSRRAPQNKCKTQQWGAVDGLSDLSARDGRRHESKVITDSLRDGDQAKPVKPPGQNSLNHIT